MRHESIKLLPGYKWIVHDPDLLGGKPAIKGMRISVALVLESLAIGMTADDLVDDYPGFPKDCIPEVLKFAARQADVPLEAA
ncbi:MAG: DUF433 domain-containing protein [Deltaproteobacteria bacterium]|nr:DUF433 domain-containing protein [Deltaproteobacteria bacterium]MBI3293614.1 DUF433 domain-containing protein [Deltaproteobacteria bacterium]